MAAASPRCTGTSPGSRRASAPGSRVRQGDVDRIRRRHRVGNRPAPALRIQDRGHAPGPDARRAAEGDAGSRRAACRVRRRGGRRGARDRRMRARAPAALDSNSVAHALSSASCRARASTGSTPCWSISPRHPLAASPPRGRLFRTPCVTELLALSRAGMRRRTRRAGACSHRARRAIRRGRRERLSPRPASPAPRYRGDRLPWPDCSSPAGTRVHDPAERPRAPRRTPGYRCRCGFPPSRHGGRRAGRTACARHSTMPSSASPARIAVS